MPSLTTKRLTPENLAAVAIARRTYGLAGRPIPQIIRVPWREEARPDQLEPAGIWRVWLVMAGRGYGKTRMGGEWSAENARKYPGCRIALVAQTFADGRDTMVEGVSGLLRCLDADEIKTWNRSIGELVMVNGSRFKVFSSEKPRSLRGPQHHFAWGDEPAQWNDAPKGTAEDTTWTNLNFGLRLPPRPSWPRDYQSRACLTTTPRRVALLKSRDVNAPGLLQQPRVHVTLGRTADNLANLDDTFRTNVVEPLIGTRLGRQELEGELLEDVQGALWSYDLLEKTRVTVAPESMRRIVIGVDPAVTSTSQSDETGVVVAGIGIDGHGYVLADLSGRMTPSAWAKRVATGFDQFDADLVVGEVNNGGDLVEANLRVEAPLIRYKKVHASRGKAVRAEPVSTLWEAGRVHLVGTFPELEEQLCTWVPDAKDAESPDRLDALVWTLTELLVTPRRWGPAGG